MKRSLHILFIGILFSVITVALLADCVKKDDPISAAHQTDQKAGIAAPSIAETKAIAEEAFIYGLPLVMLYGIMNEYAINENSGQFKAPFNEIKNVARVFTPADTAIISPNSDTPYSFAWMDLRAEPVVLCVPEMAKDRYYSIMITSQYTFNFGYIGSRATGNGAGCYAVAGPGWKGSTPEGIKEVFASETDFALALYRTQLFNAADIDNVKAIQAKYYVQPLSAFLDQPAPVPAPAIDWPCYRYSQVPESVLLSGAFGWHWST